MFSLQPRTRFRRSFPVADQFAILKCEGGCRRGKCRWTNVRERARRTDQGRKTAYGGERLVREAAEFGHDSERVERRRNCGSRCRASWRRSTASRFSTRNWPRSACCGTAKQVLEVEISHLLLQQALAKQNVAVTQAGPRRRDLPCREAGRRRRQSTAIRTSTSGSRWPPKSRGSRRNSTCATRCGRRRR